VPRPDEARGVYGISVAAELVGMGVQTLRLYEARGLLEPDRTEGGTRRYSAYDLDRLRRIGDLLDAGLNLAGIGYSKRQDENTRLRADKEKQPWLTTASIPASRSPKRTSSSSKPRSTRR
jgi:DNA-binding transcriptional MerR regulator